MTKYLRRAGLLSAAWLGLFPMGAQAAILPVTNTNDNGPGSLREAVSIAVSGDVIVFDATTNGSPIVLTTGEIAIGVPLTITGNDTTNTIISGGGMFRVFNIANAGMVNIDGVKLTMGFSATEGGALMVNNTTLSLTGSAVTASVAGMRGGGIHISGGSLALVGSWVRANTAMGPAATDGGGGIYNQAGAVSISNGSAVVSNVATGTAGSGGGIFNNAAGMLTVSNSSITGNSAVRAGGGIEQNAAGSSIMLTDVMLNMNSTGGNPGNGGGMHITGPGSATITGGTVNGNFAALEGGGLWNGTGSMTVNGTTINGNTAAGALADQGGGGIFNNAKGTLIVENGTMITNNMATGAAGSGGGILCDSTATLTVSNSTIDGNNAPRAGGGIEFFAKAGQMQTASLTNVTLSNNTTGSAPGNGGGVHITGPGTMTITGCTVTGNMAALEGGGLWNGTGTMTVNSSTIDGNTAAGALADQGGGGIFNNAKGTLIVENGTMITNNLATGAAGSGGGILCDSTATLTVSNSTIDGNNAPRAGGGIEFFAKAGQLQTASLTNVTLSNNTTGSAPGNGGGVHITGPGNMTITGCTVTGNTAALEGGGLWNGTGTMTVNSSTIDGNTAAGALADQGGGGIFNNAKGTLIVQNGTLITNNMATGAAGSGGGILCDSTATLTVSNSTIDGNSAPRAGGGIEFFAKGGQMQTASLMNVTISDNTTGSAPGNGGGVHITGPGNMTVTGCTVMGNTAAAEGGGLWNGSGTMTIDDCDVSGNVANGSVNPVGAPGGALDLQGGGGIFNNLGTVNIVNVSGATNITGNTAGGAPFGSGGGILSAGGSFSITGATISMNETARAGGGIENAASSMSVTSSVINGNDCSLAGALAAASPGNGGGVHVTGAGTMTVSMCTVDGNTAGNEGGGLWGSGTGTLTVLRTTASNNTAPDGGGLFLQAGPTGVLNMDFSTSSGNTATNGGGVQTEGGTFNITGSTIASNTASTGGGVNVIATAVNSRSAIIADNTAGTGPDLNGAFASAMFTLLENGTGATGIMNGSNGNIVGTDPMLQGLANNGGPTGTHALACGSAAVDAGDPALMGNDQRGTPVQGMARDMGAFEQDATTLLSLEIQADGVGTILWELRAEGTNTLVANGGQLYPSGPAMESICIAPGCYYLVVTDDGGDGILNGGYVLREEASGLRIIDNTGNFSTGSVSAISGGQGFCLPMSDDKLLFTSCDKLDWISGQYVVAAPNAAVSAEWIPNGANNVQDTNSGYEFWIFDPNGSYSFRRFRSHSQSDGFGPASATRACHMKLNNWAVASQVPANVLMNVRVRARINGVNGAYGPACRLEVDPVLAACPRTNLMDVPGSSQFSCGVTREFGPGNYVYARPVSGANRYQFRFSQPNEGVVAVRTSTNYILQLNWVTGALLAGETYDVEVRVSKNNGATWCTNDAVWGPVCQLTIGAPGAVLGSANFAGIADVAELRMFPNPNRGDALNFSISAIEEGVNTVSMDIYDLTGKRMIARTIAVADGNVNTVIDLAGELAAGMYLVNITAGDNTYTERLVIQP